MNLPTLYTKRLIIRPLAVSDAEDMYEYAKTNLVGPKAGWAPHINLNETFTILRNMVLFKPQYELGNWAIVDKNTNKMIGTIELYNYIPNFKAELGYALNPAYWGQGLVTEAGLKVLEFGFDSLELKRIEAGTFLDNYQSQRVCEKLGMTREGVQRNGYIRYDGIIFDKVVYGITVEEYRDFIKKH
jgi:RimJ/RimL family protein N-acetyltransferase